MINDGDWRLTDQDTYLVGRSFQWSRWLARKSSSEHDHCAFCWAEISGSVTEHVEYDAAWVTADDGYTWVCAPCFSDFRQQFAFVVV